MESFYLSFRDSRIHCLRFGRGPVRVICFHGYGETAAHFAFLEHWAGERFSFYSLDLPFHGQTAWAGKSLEPEDVENIITGILEQFPPSGPAENKIQLIGFSLGGRVALSVYPLMAEKVGRLILLAPDGLKVNFWYWLSTQTWLGNRLFAFTMRKPLWFLGFIKLLHQLGLVNASIFKFVHHYIGNEQVRKDLYERWTGLRKLRPDLPVIKENIKQHKTQVELVYGKYDRIILSSVGQRFKKGIAPHTHITLIHAGHQVLHEKHAAELMKVLQS